MGLLRRTSKEEAAPKLGYLGGFAEQYELGQQLGKGGNGVVRLAVHKQTGGLPLPVSLRNPQASSL